MTTVEMLAISAEEVVRRQQQPPTDHLR
jgi:hypothetical protein